MREYKMHHYFLNCVVNIYISVKLCVNVYDLLKPLTTLINCQHLYVCVCLSVCMLNFYEKWVQFGKIPVRISKKLTNTHTHCYKINNLTEKCWNECIIWDYFIVYKIKYSDIHPCIACFHTINDMFCFCCWCCEIYD